MAYLLADRGGDFESRKAEVLSSWTVCVCALGERSVVSLFRPTHGAVARDNLAYRLVRNFGMTVLGRQAPRYGRAREFIREVDGFLRRPRAVANPGKDGEEE